MSVIVEDGSIVSDANSFVSVNDFYLYAAARGYEIAGNPDVALIKAGDYINGLESKLKGSKVERSQSMAFPRYQFEAEGWNWSSNEIPRQVINAQLTLAIEIDQGFDPNNPVAADLPVIKESVDGAVSVEYANPNRALKVNKEQPSKVHINLLLKRNGLTLIRS